MDNKIKKEELLKEIKELKEELRKSGLYSLEEIEVVMKALSKNGKQIRAYLFSQENGIVRR